MRINSTAFKVILLLLALVSLNGCNRGGDKPTTATAEGSPTQSKTQATPATEFERDLQYVRNSNFQHVWLFSRKDGKVLDSIDSNFLRTNAPQVIDWVKTDEGRKVFAGSNFDLEQGGLNQIRKRFVVEDYTGK